MEEPLERDSLEESPGRGLKELGSIFLAVLSLGADWETDLDWRDSPACDVTRRREGDLRYFSISKASHKASS